MSSITVEPTTDVRVDARRARFREAVAGLSTRAKSGDLLRMLLAPGSFLVVLGFGLMLLGWYGAARTHREIEQIPYLISGGLLGLGFVVLGGLILATAVWMALLQRMREQADERMAAHIAQLVAAMPQPAPAAPAPVASTASPAKPRKRGAALQAKASA